MLLDLFTRRLNYSNLLRLFGTFNALKRAVFVLAINTLVDEVFRMWIDNRSSNHVSGGMRSGNQRIGSKVGSQNEQCVV